MFQGFLYTILSAIAIALRLGGVVSPSFKSLAHILWGILMGQAIEHFAFHKWAITYGHNDAIHYDDRRRLPLLCFGLAVILALVEGYCAFIR